MTITQKKEENLTTRVTVPQLCTVNVYAVIQFFYGVWSFGGSQKSVWMFCCLFTHVLLLMIQLSKGEGVISRFNPATFV
jgi:hypothetical protein